MSDYMYTGECKVKIHKSIAFIQNELRDLDVPIFSHAYKTVFQNALAYSEIATKSEVKKYIEEYLETLPNHYFL